MTPGSVYRVITSSVLGCLVLIAASSGARDARAPSPDVVISIAHHHYGVADALQLDAATFDRLIVLLANQLTDQSEYVQATFAGGAGPRHPMDRLREDAEHVTRRVSALRDLLGQEKFESYQKLQVSLGHRGQVREFDERLAASDKLSGTQRERLVELLHEHSFSSMQRRAPSLLDEVQLDWKLQTLTCNEQIWREMPESNRRLRERAAEFLNQPQLAMLGQMHSEQAATLQRHIEQMRTHLGLSPTIPEQADVLEALPATVDRNVRLSVMAAVNSESPRYLTTVVSSGKPVSLKIADGLFLEATPIVFEDDVYHLRVQYFEAGVTGKRLIGSSAQSGMIVRANDGRSHSLGGGSGSVITGSKGYAVELSALVEAT